VINEWHLWTVRVDYDNTDLHFYKDGNLVGSDLTLGSFDLGYISNNDLIGGRYHPGFGTIRYFMAGIIDEVRISRVDHNEDWITTTFNTIDNAYDGGFFSIGPEESKEKNKQENIMLLIQFLDRFMEQFPILSRLLNL
jgi:hypothetical protein